MGLSGKAEFRFRCIESILVLILFLERRPWNDLAGKAKVAEADQHAILWFCPTGAWSPSLAQKIHPLKFGGRSELTFCLVHNFLADL